MRLRGFSLIELLVVIAILAALAALLFPVFSSARENGRLAKCFSNLRQYGAAVQMYRNDWDGIDPDPGVRAVASMYEAGFPPGSEARRFERAYHLDDPDVYYCPSARWVHPRFIRYPYPLAIWASDDDPMRWVEVLNRRGGDYPLTHCFYHNANPDPITNPTWATLRVAVLRLNQSVRVVNIRAYPVNSMEF